MLLIYRVSEINFSNVLTVSSSGCGSSTIGDDDFFTSQGVRLRDDRLALHSQAASEEEVVRASRETECQARREQALVVCRLLHDLGLEQLVRTGLREINKKIKLSKNEILNEKNNL